MSEVKPIDEDDLYPATFFGKETRAVEMNRFKEVLLEIKKRRALNIRGDQTKFVKWDTIEEWLGPLTKDLKQEAKFPWK